MQVCRVFVLLMLLCGHVCGHNATTELSTEFLYRQTQDIGRILEDVKTLIMMQSHNQRELVNNQRKIFTSQREIATSLRELAVSHRDMLTTQRDIVNKLDALSRKEGEQKQGWQGGCGGNVTGLSTISVQGRVLTVPCDGQGWIVIQRRMNNDYDFPNQDWETYKRGFGNPLGSFWLGLEHMHVLTHLSQAALRVELEDFEGETTFAQYSFFRIESEKQKYRLLVGGHSGTAGDSLAYHNGMMFTTKDRDNDLWSDNCATTYNGAWWFNACRHSDLNSIHSSTESSSKLRWHVSGVATSYYKNVAMKMLI